MTDFQLVAHRGYPKRFPDNSLSGILAAIKAGAKYVEIDVQLSTSGTPWLMHDETLERVCGRVERLVDLDDAAIEALRASETARFGSQFAKEPVASLAEVAFELGTRDDVFTFVEIKPVAVETFGADVVVDAVAACLLDLEDNVAIISFSMDCLRAVVDRTPFLYGLILERWDQITTDAREIDGDFLFCNYLKLPPEGVLELGAELAVYEVVDPELAKSLGARGAQFVETIEFPEMKAALGL